MARRSAKFYIDGDASGVKRATHDADRSLDKLGKSGSKSMGGLNKAGLLAAGGIGLGAAGLGTALVAVTRAAMEAEKAQARLNTTLTAIGKNTPAIRKEIDGIIDSQSKMSGFDDELLSESYRRILTVTKDVKKATDLNALAMDIARSRSIDVARAGDIVAKAYNGQTGALAKLGVKVIENKDATNALQDRIAALRDKLKGAEGPTATAIEQEIKLAEKQRDAAAAADKHKTAIGTLGNAQKTFAGQAEAYGKTTSGAVDRMNVSWENLQERLGKGILPTLATVANKLATEINSALDDTSASVARARKAWHDFGEPVRDVNEALGGVGETAGQVVGLGAKFFNSVIGWKRAFLLVLGPATAVTVMLERAVAAANAFSEIGRAGGLGPVAQRAIDQANANSGRGSPIPGRGRAMGGYIPGSGSGDTVPAMLTPGEVVLNARQQAMLGPSSIASVLAQTGGVMGGRRYASGGVAANAIAPALAFARRQLGKRYQWGAGHAYGEFPTYDCSGFATNVASRIKGYRTGIGGTALVGPASRTPATTTDPVAFGFRGGFGGGRGSGAHMGIRLNGVWYSAGDPIHTGDSRWDTVRVPAGLEYLRTAGGSFVTRGGKTTLVKAAEGGSQKVGGKAPGGSNAAPVTTGTYNEDARGIGRPGAPTIGSIGQPGPAIVPETVTDSTPVEPVPDPGPNADDLAMRERILQMLGNQQRANISNSSFGNVMSGSNDIFGGMGMMLLGDPRSLSSWADQTAKSLYTQGAVDPGRVRIGV